MLFRVQHRPVRFQVVVVHYLRSYEDRQDAVSDFGFFVLEKEAKDRDIAQDWNFTDRVALFLLTQAADYDCLALLDGDFGRRFGFRV